MKIRGDWVKWLIPYLLSEVEKFSETKEIHNNRRKLGCLEEDRIREMLKCLLLQTEEFDGRKLIHQRLQISNKILVCVFDHAQAKQKKKLL